MGMAWIETFICEPDAVAVRAIGLSASCIAPGCCETEVHLPTLPVECPWLHFCGETH